MDKKNRNTRAQLSDDRKDLFLWSRILGNLKKLTALREENNTIGRYITEAKYKLEKTSPEAAHKISSKLHKYLKEGDESAMRIKSAISDIKDDLRAIKIMQAVGDFSAIPDKELKRQRLDLEQPQASMMAGSSTRPISRPKQHAPKDHIPIGSMVAAKMTESKDPNQEWILATVIHYYPDRLKYQVEDAEADEADGQKSKYILSAKYVIKLPEEQDLSYENEFPPGHEVLALYPNTTCFYKATVITPPSKNRGRGLHAYDYMVHFDDDDNAERFIQRHNVVNMPAVLKSR